MDRDRTVTEYSTSPNPAAKSYANEERPSYVVYWPAARLYRVYLSVDMLCSYAAVTYESPITSTFLLNSLDLARCESVATDTFANWIVLNDEYMDTNKVSMYLSIGPVRNCSQFR